MRHSATQWGRATDTGIREGRGRPAGALEHEHEARGRERRRARAPLSPLNVSLVPPPATFVNRAALRCRGSRLSLPLSLSVSLWGSDWLLASCQFGTEQLFEFEFGWGFEAALTFVRCFSFSRAFALSLSRTGFPKTTSRK